MVQLSNLPPHSVENPTRISLVLNQQMRLLYDEPRDYAPLHP